MLMQRSPLDDAAGGPRAGSTGGATAIRGSGAAATSSAPRAVGSASDAPAAAGSGLDAPAAAGWGLDPPADAGSGLDAPPAAGSAAAPSVVSTAAVAGVSARTTGTPERASGAVPASLTRRIGRPVALGVDAGRAGSANHAVQAA